MKPAIFLTILLIALLSFAAILKTPKSKLQDTNSVIHDRCSYATLLKGKVVNIVDGDTIDVALTNDEIIRVRLAGIDTPELEPLQPYANAATRYIENLALSKQVVLKSNKVDHYGRLVAKVNLNNLDVNLTLVKAGLAWQDKIFEHEQCSFDREQYKLAEKNARNLADGIWSQKRAIEPWLWRK